MMKRVQTPGLAQPDQKPHASSDTVYSMGLLDNWEQFKRFYWTFAYKFNDVLDPEKLHVSLSRLLEIGDWRRLGGQLRYNLILHPWSLVMAGRESEVPPLLGTEQDLSRMAGDPDVPVKEPWRLEQQALTGFGTLVFIIRFVWNLLFGPKMYPKTIIVPEASVTKLVARARNDIKNSSEEVPFVSEGDVITGWLSKVAARREGYRNGQSVRTVINLRFWLPSLVQPGGTYFQNLIATAFTTLTPEFLKSSTVGDIALRHRQSLVLSGTQHQLRGFMQKIRNLLEKSRGASLLMVGPPTYALMLISNWTKARFFHTADFSAAVVHRGDGSGSRRNPPGTVVGIQVLEQQPGLLLKGTTAIVGKDHNGDHWIMWCMTEAGWAALEEDLRKLAC